MEDLLKQNSKPKIFISYAHTDNDYLEDLEKYITPIAENHGFAIWHDKKILSGQQLFNIINQELNEFSLMICLISPDYLSSSACQDEFNIVLEKTQSSDINTINVFPIIVRNCSWAHSNVSKFKCQPNDGQPISKLLKENDKDDVYVDIADALAKTLGELKKTLSRIKN